MTKELVVIEDRKLTLKQERFCQMYVSEKFFGNGTRAYQEAYKKKDPDTGKEIKVLYGIAGTGAKDNLIKPNIVKRINVLLEKEGFSNENVDKQHLFLINQHADFKTKMSAIKEYNVLKKRIDKGGNVVVPIQINIGKILDELENE